MKLIELISGKNISLENKILNTALSITLIICALAALGNFVFNIMPLEVNLIVIASILIMALLIYIGRIKGQYKVAKIAYITIAFLVLSPGWFLLQGTAGTMSINYILVALICISVVQRKSFLLTLFIIHILTLITLDHLNPSWTIPYPNDEARFWDFALGEVYVLLLSGILIINLKVNYDKEKQKVEGQKLQIQQKNDELNNAFHEIKAQKEEIERTHLRISESIHYAKSIQNALMPEHEISESFFSDHFILYKPKDVVSGDFWWYHQKALNNKTYDFVAVADSTGHGVPGAMMSMLGVSLLNELVTGNNTLHTPEVILNMMRDRIKKNLNQTNGTQNLGKDAIEMALCLFDREKNQLYYSGAGRPLYHIKSHTQETELEIIKGSRQPVGIYHIEKPFELKKISFAKGDKFFMFSDGIPDQFDSTGKEKFGSRRLKELLIKNNHLSLSEMKTEIERTLHKWSLTKPQIDDQILVGLKI